MILKDIYVHDPVIDYMDGMNPHVRLTWTVVGWLVGLS